MNELYHYFISLIIYTLDFAKGVNIAQCLMSKVKGVIKGVEMYHPYEKGTRSYIPQAS